MLEYHVAYHEIEDGWIMAKVLDFPGAVTQGRTLNSARRMIRDALNGLADFVLEKGEALPRPNPRAKDAGALLVEKIGLRIRAETEVLDEKKKALAAPGQTRVHLRTRRR